MTLLVIVEVPLVVIIEKYRITKYIITQSILTHDS